MASDITYFRTHEGFLYLAVVIDLFSRRVIGSSMQGRSYSDLPLKALLRIPAIEERRNCHARIGQKARKSANPTASVTRQPSQADARARHHSREQQTPP